MRRHSWALWPAFALVHLVLGLLCLHAPGQPLGDVTLVYAFWVERATEHGIVVGLDTPWVYPILALVPLLAAAAFGMANYAMTWLAMIVLLNAAAFALLVRRSVSAAWWWLGFLALLGPISLARIDAVTVPLALAGMLLALSRPHLAGVLLALATWIKVWPAALVAAALIALRRRSRMLLAVAATTLAITLAALLLGGARYLLSFVTEQAGRGLQVEAPVATPWLWLALFRVPGAEVYYDRGILTYQVAGPGVEATAVWMTPVLAVVVLAIAALGLRARWAGAECSWLLVVLSLALVTALIVVNKVGSPQFAAWLAVPVLAGLVLHPERFRPPAALALAIAGLTHVVYPYLYGWLLALDPLLLLVLGIRNALYLVLAGWAVRELWRAATDSTVTASGRRPDRIGTSPRPSDGS